MKLKFKYTEDLVNYLIKIEKYKTALDYLFLPTRKKTKIDYDNKLNDDMNNYLKSCLDN